MVIIIIIIMVVIIVTIITIIIKIIIIVIMIVDPAGRTLSSTEPLGLLSFLPGALQPAPTSLFVLCCFAREADRTTDSQQVFSRGNRSSTSGPTQERKATACSYLRSEIAIGKRNGLSSVLLPAGIYNRHATTAHTRTTMHVEAIW